MNLPNKLTVLRIILVPVFMLCYIYGSMNIAAIIFIIASLTDWFDGYIARRDKIVTNFGKFMDPLADKLLVTGAFLCLMESCTVSIWVIMIVLTREFLVTGLRLVAVSEGMVIAAGPLGKIKTALQMAAVIVALITGSNIVTDILIYSSTILTAWSGIDYIVRNRNVFTA